MEAVHAIVKNAGIGAKVISKIAFLQEKHTKKIIKGLKRIKKKTPQRLC